MTERTCENCASKPVCIFWRANYRRIEDDLGHGLKGIREFATPEIIRCYDFRSQEDTEEKRVWERYENECRKLWDDIEQVIMRFIGQHCDHFMEKP